MLVAPLWGQVSALIGAFEPPVWDSLLLDAEVSLPAVGPAVTLACTALETFLDWATPKFRGHRRLPADYWDWLANRRRAPEPPEQLDSLLVLLAGHSLKTEQVALWQEFRELERARNTLVHGGIAYDTKGQIVTAARAQALLGSAKQMIDWVEGWLPARHRQPRYTGTHALELSRTF